MPGNSPTLYGHQMLHMIENWFLPPLSSGLSSNAGWFLWAPHISGDFLVECCLLHERFSGAATQSGQPGGRFFDQFPLLLPLVCNLRVILTAVWRGSDLSFKENSGRKEGNENESVACCVPALPAARGVLTGRLTVP